MPKIDETRPFIPVRIAVLTVSDTRGLADDRSGDALVADDRERRPPAGGPRHRQGRRARDQGQGAGLDRRPRRRRRHHHRRHRLHRPRRDAGSRQAAVREGGRRLLHGLPHDLVPEGGRPPPSSRAPAPAWRRAPTSSACRARPAPARMPGTTSSSGSSTTATAPAISSRSCPAWRSIAARAERTLDARSALIAGLLGALDGDQLARGVGLVEQRARHLAPEHDREAGDASRQPPPRPPRRAPADMA